MKRRDIIRSLAAGWAGLLVSPRARVRATTPLPRQQQRPPELLIRGGRVVNVDGVVTADVRIVGETIAEVGPGLSPGPGARIIEAGSGRLLAREPLLNPRVGRGMP